MRLLPFARAFAAAALASAAAAQFSAPSALKGVLAHKGQKIVPTKQQLAAFTPAPRFLVGTSALVGGSDDCATPETIAGPGPHAFDTTAATTGAAGQGGALCFFFGSTALYQDVWFTWTAPSTQNFRLSLCGGASFDSKVAVYDGSGCPTGSAIACSDDSCGVVSELTFAGIAAQSYTIQLGSYGVGVTAVGSFTVQPLASTPANDNCNLPVVINGTGTFVADTTSATTSAQQIGSCATANQDIWFSWIAPSSGVAVLDTCAGGVDTVVGAWAGSGCGATPLVCSDDGCGYPDSRATFAVTAGSNYMIQMGGYGTVTYVSTFQLNVSTSPAHDNCATPLAIVGAGPHAFDSSNASASTQGQTESLCAFFGSMTVDHDLWFTWTASSSGLQTWDFCSGGAGDTKIAIYNGAGCPSAGTALACNDDRCGWTSQLCFQSVAGNTYTLQVGTFPGATGSSGSFTITPTSAGATNDDCANPASISGLGPHNFDTTTATTGCQGQDNGVCNYFGTTAIERDQWFTWTAPSTSLYQVSLCGQAGGFDSKVAVYAGTGCPTASSALACDDDGCGTISGESKTCFQATAGLVYTIQVGAALGAGGAAGTLTFSALLQPVACQYDNGTSENAFGLTAGGAVLWMHRFGDIGTTSTVSSISSAFGSALFPGTFPVGTPCIAAIWDDPTDDGNPADAVLLQQVAGVVGNVYNDALDTFALTSPQAAAGVYFVGVSVVHAAGEFPMPMDQDSCPSGSGGRAWLAGNDVTGILDLVTLSANPIPPAEMDAQGLPAVWLLRANCTTSVGTAGCFGDGTDTACPCGNESSVPGTGCKHSFSDSTWNGAGARLAGTGSANIGSDTLQFQATTMPPTSTCLFFQGTTDSSVVFGDGLRCISGVVIRLGQRSVVGGVRSFGSGIAGDTAIHTLGQVTSPGTRGYQVWFRNTLTFCTPSGFNLTNRLSINWGI